MPNRYTSGSMLCASCFGPAFLSVLSLLAGCRAIAGDEGATTAKVEAAGAHDSSRWVLRDFPSPKSARWADFVAEFAQERRVVGLGECSHYSAECYELKSAAIRRLAEEGFDGLVLEVDFGQAILWDDYVVRGEGDLDQLVGRTGWFTYRTQEFKDLLAALREHNRVSDKPFHVFGMEMTALEPGLGWLTSTIEDEAGDLEGAAGWVAELRLDRTYVAFAEHSPEERIASWRLFARGDAFLVRHRDQLVARMEAKTLARVERMVEITRQYATYVAQDDGSLKAEFRDQFAARNVLWCANQFGAEGRVVLWAHNGHVARRSPVQGYDVLGHYLGRWFGDAYGAIGFTFNEGELGAYGSEGFERVRFGRAPSPSLTATLAERGAPFAILDVRATLDADPGRTSALRREVEIRRDVGESFSDEEPRMWRVRLDDVYDALVYFENSHFPTTLDWIR